MNLTTEGPLYLGLDVGTQGTKAQLYDAQRHCVIATGSSSYGILPSSVPGRAEQHPSTWLQGVREATAQALAGVDAARVRGLAVSGQQHGMVVLDEHDQVLRPAKLWCDTESAAEAEELSEKLGWAIVPSFTITKLLWLKRHEPAAFAAARCLLLPHDFVNCWLTGRKAMELGDASGTGLLDVAAGAWDATAVAAVDPRVGDMLPPLVGPDQPIGALLPGPAAELGLPPGIPVAPGSGDNAMSALGAGATGDGSLVVSLGTSGTVFARSPAPVPDPSGAICAFRDATGAHLPLLCTLNCTRVLEEVREAFGLSHAQLSELAAAEPHGCGGLTWLPYLAGERTPCWPHASGALLGMRPGCLRPGLLYRAAMEGATLSLLAGYRRMRAAGLPAPAPAAVTGGATAAQQAGGGGPPTHGSLRLVGGGSRNPLWAQLVADAFQMAVLRPAESEAAALGAALQAAAVAVGVPVGAYVEAHPPALLGEAVLPNPAHAAAYEEALERFERLGRTLFQRGPGAGRH